MNLFYDGLETREETVRAEDQLRRLKSQVKHAASNSKYYREALAGCEIYFPPAFGWHTFSFFAKSILRIR